MIRNKSPKVLRIAEKKRRWRALGALGFGTSKTFVTTTQAQNRSERLPPYDDYNPRKVHVARRRQTSDDHYRFPRGWTFDLGDKDYTVETTVGGTATLFKDSDTTWYVDGKEIS